jgi:sugar diacid utilization regulator
LCIRSACGFDRDGSIAKAAEQLFCNLNTVRYRLHRIEERTGRTLSAPRDLAELCLVVCLSFG